MMFHACDGCSKTAPLGDLLKFLIVYKPGGRKSGRTKTLHYHKQCVPSLLLQITPS